MSLLSAPLARLNRPSLALLALCAVWGWITPARADIYDSTNTIFNVTGQFASGSTLSGTLTLNSGSVFGGNTAGFSAADLTVSGPNNLHFTNVISQGFTYDGLIGPSARYYVVDVGSSANPQAVFYLPTTLVNFQEFANYSGGPIAPAVGNGYYSAVYSAAGGFGTDRLTSGSIGAGTAAPKTVFLDFGADPDANYVRGDVNIPFNKPNSGLSLADLSTVTSEIQSIYSGININFVTTKPTSGDFDTIYIGGTPAIDLPSSEAQFLNKNGINGVAADINIGNKLSKQSAVVFSDNPIFGFTYSANCLIPLNHCNPSSNYRLAQVIAHEEGHLSGLVHVQPLSELLNPASTSSIFNTNISNAPVLITQQSDMMLSDPDAITQNSYSILGCNIGLLSGSKNCSTIDAMGLVQDGANVSIDVYGFSLASSLYNAIFFVTSPDPDTDVGPIEDYIGNISPGLSSNIIIPFVSGDSISLFASTSQNGPLEEIDGSYSSISNSFYIEGSYSVPEISSLTMLITIITLSICIRRLRSIKS